jgi:predicted NBD/HSP70 family sugar kinase
VSGSVATARDTTTTEGGDQVISQVIALLTVAVNAAGVASGPAIARAAYRTTSEEAFRAAREGDRVAQVAARRAAEVLGVAAANIATLTDPEVIQ